MAWGLTSLWLTEHVNEMVGGGDNNAEVTFDGGTVTIWSLKTGSFDVDPGLFYELKKEG